MGPAKRLRCKSKAGYSLYGSRSVGVRHWMAPRWALVRHDMARGVWGSMHPSMLYIWTRTMSSVKNQANWNLFLSCPHWPVTTDQRETCQYFTGYLKFQKEKVVQKFLHVRGWKALSWFNICWLRYIEGRKGAEGWSAHATNDPRKGRLHHNDHFCSAFLPGGTFVWGLSNFLSCYFYA